MDRTFHGQSAENGLATVLGPWMAGRGPLYRQLAVAVRAAVERGDLPDGTRLPPERVLAAQLRISRSTVVAAYERLQDEQVIERRQGSGTRVLAQAEAGRAQREPRATLVRELGRNALFRGLIDRPSTTVDLIGAYLLAPSGIPPRVLEGLERELASVLDESGYSPLGYPPLRQAIAEFLSARGLSTAPEQILVTSGAQQAIHLTAWLYLERGDTVLVENPTYPGALDSFNGLGARVTGVPTGRHGVDLERLGELMDRLDPRLVYVIPTYQNPVGSLMVAARRRMLANLVEEHAAMLLEDDSLANLGLGDDEPAPIAAHASPKAASILTVGSLSKLFWGGLRVGWIRGPEPVITQLGRLKAVTDLGGSWPSQLLATRLLRDIDTIAIERRQLLAERLALVTSLMERWLPAWHWDPPRGGLCLWVRLPLGNAVQFQQVALRHGVSIVPGTVASVDGSFADHLRIPFGHHPAVLEEATQRLARAWDAYAPAQDARPQNVAVVV